MPFKVEPAEASLPAIGGQSTHQLVNETNTKMMFKVKCSNNDEYRVKPVYGFLDPAGKTDIEVTRYNGAPRADRLVVQFANAPNNVTDAKEAFGKVEDVPRENMFTINLNAT